MEIKHYPLHANTDAVCEHYGDPNDIFVHYVCTTHPRANTDSVVADIFYQTPPHPEYMNHYFGIYSFDGNTYICDADEVEDFVFAMVENDEGKLEYSSHRHDYKMFDNGNMIDGGRDYVRCSGDVVYYQLANGVFNEVRIDD
jgi:hypothetical protein